MQGRRHRGFTLLEFLVVFAVLLILAAILFPVFARLREPPHRHSSCQSNLKQLALGFMMYTQDYNNVLPRTKGVSSSSAAGWARALEPYIKSRSLYQCPNDNFEPDTSPSSTSFTDYFYNSNLGQYDTAKLNYPAQVILLGEGEVASSNYSCSSFLACTGFNSSGLVGAVPETAKRRHLDGANYAFAEGHVKWLKPERIMKRPEKNGYSFGFR